jgi:hypothetical protein
MAGDARTGGIALGEPGDRPGGASCSPGLSGSRHVLAPCRHTDIATLILAEATRRRGRRSSADDHQDELDAGGGGAAARRQRHLRLGRTARPAVPRRRRGRGPADGGGPAHSRVPGHSLRCLAGGRRALATRRPRRRLAGRATRARAGPGVSAAGSRGREPEAHDDRARRRSRLGAAARSHERGLPDAERLHDPDGHRRAPAGDGLAARRGEPYGQRRHRRGGARPSRRRGGDRELPAGPARVPGPSGARPRVAARLVGRLRAAGPDRGAALGAPQHRRLRR